MTESAAVLNPFMLLLNPEIILAAIEKSERLSQLNRRLCRPLDKAAPAAAGARPEAADAELDRDDDSGRASQV